MPNSIRKNGPQLYLGRPLYAWVFIAAGVAAIAGLLLIH